MAEETKRYPKAQIEQMIEVLQTQLTELNEEPNEKNGYSRNKRVICNICGGSYTRGNGATHRKTRKHKNEVQHLEAINRLIKSKGLDGR